MKKYLKISSIILGVVIFITIVWVSLILFFYTGVRPYVPDPVYSPDGSKVIIPTVNYYKEIYEKYLLVHFKVQDTHSKEILFEVQTHASDRMRWSIAWVGNNTVLLDSSDIGLYCWKEKNGTWIESECP
jgi:hypothetical protein